MTFNRGGPPKKTSLSSGRSRCERNLANVAIGYLCTALATKTQWRVIFDAMRLLESLPLPDWIKLMQRSTTNDKAGKAGPASTPSSSYINSWLPSLIYGSRANSIPIWVIVILVCVQAQIQQLQPTRMLQVQGSVSDFLIALIPITYA